MEEKPTISDQLSSEPQSKLQSMLESYSDLTSSTPSGTTLIQHSIEMGEARPVGQSPYRLAHAYCEVVKKELQEMQECSIIEPATSGWACPIVPI